MGRLTFGRVGSGLIYAVIIGMWAAYFIPMWLRRHEERSEARSVDRFSNAMRILSRRHQADDAAGDPPARERHASKPQKRSRPATARSLVFRRRRILTVLLLTTAVVGVATPWTPLTWRMAMVPLAATLGYLVHLRMQARRSRELSRTRESVRRRTLARLRRFDSAERIFQARRTLREERAERLAGEQAAHAARHQEAPQEASGWDPVPVPLPTYVTKPAAPRPAPPVPAYEPAQEPFDQTVVAAAGSAESAPAGRAEGDELDAVVDRRRAVND